MKIKNTKKEYEHYLSDIYSNYDSERLHEIFAYIIDRHKGVRYKDLTQKAGGVLRRYDPVAFEVGYKDWCNR